MLACCSFLRTLDESNSIVSLRRHPASRRVVRTLISPVLLPHWSMTYEENRRRLQCSSPTSLMQVVGAIFSVTWFQMYRDTRENGYNTWLQLMAGEWYHIRREAEYESELYDRSYCMVCIVYSIIYNRSLRPCPQLRLGRCSWDCESGRHTSAGFRFGPTQKPSCSSGSR
jgi:hypothetical protein